MIEGVGSGGFIFPQVFCQSKDYVTKKLQDGAIDHADFSSWSFADNFFSYLLSKKFIEFIDETYPSPRKKTEVPIWFLICCQISMRLALKNSYSSLPAILLNSGPILLKIGFNVSSKDIGFNNKNKKERKTYVDDSTVLKFFKDSEANNIRNWYNIDLQYWFRREKYFDDKGIYVLDQTHCVVPDNENYKDAVRMPVDEHGQLYKKLDTLTPEQRKALKYHPCYALSFIMHASHTKDYFHIAGYSWGAGNIDELPQGKKLIDDFNKHSNGKMKLLIVDRGYLSGEFITYIKSEYGTDVLVPLKSSMAQYQDAIELSKFSGTTWEETIVVDNSRDDEIFTKYRACIILMTTDFC
ncbi:MAG TPA: transposase [Bacteriovoracaceae bacterium]|nr:transposase [Bacteriovoracaceae bacterium]